MKKNGRKGDREKGRKGAVSLSPPLPFSPSDLASRHRAVDLACGGPWLCRCPACTKARGQFYLNRQPSGREPLHNEVARCGGGRRVLRKKLDGH